MHNTVANKVVEILLVEDNPGDARLTAEIVKEGRLPHRLHIVEDGVEAMAFLRKQGKFADVPRPNIILLDLNMPHKDGREVLVELKQDPDLRGIPVVILTSSEDQEDIANCYQSHANCYIAKPLDLEEFVVVVRSVENFWLSTVKLPSV